LDLQQGMRQNDPKATPIHSTAPRECSWKRTFRFHACGAASAPRSLQGVEERYQLTFLLLAQVHLKPLVVEIHDLEERGSLTVGRNQISAGAYQHPLHLIALQALPYPPVNGSAWGRVRGVASTPVRIAR
jgi:hypothetical protein